MARHGSGYHTEPAKQVHAGAVELDGWFYPNGAANPVSFNKALFKSVTRDSAGVWTLTLLDTKFPIFTRLLGYFVSGRDNALASFLRPGVVNLTAKTFKVENFSIAGAAADIAANAESRVNLKIVVKASPAPDGSELV